MTRILPILALLAACGGTACLAQNNDLASDAKQALRICDLEKATLATMEMGDKRTVHLMLPPELFARRGEPAIKARIACITKWGQTRGLNIQLSGTPH